MKKYRRRNYLINKNLQLRYMGMVAGRMVVISIGAVLLVYSTTWTVLIDRLGGKVVLDKVFVDLNRIVLIRVSLLIVASACVVAIVTMFIIHRIAGPLFRVKCVMRQIEEGVLPQRVKFRKGDELQDVAMGIEKAVCRIGEIDERNHKVLKEASACVERVIEQLKSGKTGTGKPREELETLRECLAKFETFQKR